ncbi:MAG: hypothetical protein JNM63_10970, partial [Spirochaetia bacterium]|nr:hypothetical protein [Spirochaetia bacterium]
MSLLLGTVPLSGESADDPLKTLLSAKDWRLGPSGAESPVATKIDGVPCLQFPALFLTNTSRAAWDKTLSADLSGASGIRFKYKVSDHRKIG